MHCMVDSLQRAGDRDLRQSFDNKLGFSHDSGDENYVKTQVSVWLKRDIFHFCSIRWKE